MRILTHVQIQIQTTLQGVTTIQEETGKMVTHLTEATTLMIQNNNKSAGKPGAFIIRLKGFGIYGNKSSTASASPSFHESLCRRNAGKGLFGK